MMTNIDMKQGKKISLYRGNDFFPQHNGGQVSPAVCQQGLPGTDGGDTFDNSKKYEVYVENV